MSEEPTTPDKVQKAVGSSASRREVIPADLTNPVGFDGELSFIDKKMLKLASNGKSPEEIAAEVGLGVTPARAAQRVREILASRDWLSQIERTALILEDMMDLKDHLISMVKGEGGDVVNEYGDIISVSSKQDPRWAANLTRLFKLIHDSIQLDQRAVEGAKSQIRRAHAQLMLGAIELAFGNFIFQIRKQYPEVDEAILRDFMEEALPKAMALVENRVAE